MKKRKLSILLLILVTHSGFCSDISLEKKVDEFCSATMLTVNEIDKESEKNAAKKKTVLDPDRLRVDVFYFQKNKNIFKIIVEEIPGGGKKITRKFYVIIPLT